VSLVEGGKLKKGSCRHSSWPLPIGKTARPLEGTAEPLAERRSGGRAFKGPGRVVAARWEAAAAGLVGFSLRGRGPATAPPQPRGRAAERGVPAPGRAQPALPLGRKRLGFVQREVGPGQRLQQPRRGSTPLSASAAQPGALCGHFTQKRQYEAKIRREPIIRNNLKDDFVTR